MDIATAKREKGSGYIKVKIKVFTARRSVASSHKSKSVFSSPPLLPWLLQRIHEFTDAAKYTRYAVITLMFVKENSYENTAPQKLYQSLALRQYE